MRLEDKTICEINIALSAVNDIHAKVEHNVDFIVSFCSSSGPSCRISETFRHLNTHLFGWISIWNTKLCLFLLMEKGNAKQVKISLKSFS